MVEVSKDVIAFSESELAATITAWESVFGSIEAHLEDRIAMGDEASPATYLSIIRASVKNLPVYSRQVYAATQVRSQMLDRYANTLQAERDRYRDRLADLVGAAGEVSEFLGEEDWPKVKAALDVYLIAARDALGISAFYDTPTVQS